MKKERERVDHEPADRLVGGRGACLRPYPAPEQDRGAQGGGIGDEERRRRFTQPGDGGQLDEDRIEREEGNARLAPWLEPVPLTDDVEVPRRVPRDPGAKRSGEPLRGGGDGEIRTRKQPNRGGADHEDREP